MRSESIAKLPASAADASFPAVPLTASSPTDVLVVGAGLIGMSCAAAAAERGFSVRLIGEPRTGESSLAAAGMLAPSVERADGPADEFGIAARDRYPAYVDWLRERTGIAVPLEIGQFRQNFFAWRTLAYPGTLNTAA